MNNRKKPINLSATLENAGTSAVAAAFSPEHATGLWLHRVMITKSAGSGTTVTLCDIEDYNGVSSALLYAARTSTMNALTMPYDSASAGFDNNPFPVYFETANPANLRVNLISNNGGQTDTITVTITVSAA